MTIFAEWKWFLAAAVLLATGLAIHHYGEVRYAQGANDIRLSDAKALILAQQAQLAAETKAAQTQSKAEQDHAALQASNDQLSGALSDSLRNLEAAVRRRSLPQASGAAAQPDSAAAGTGSPALIAGAIERVDAAVDAANRACLADSAELAAILQIVD